MKRLSSLALPALAAACLVALGACTERDQVIQPSTKKSDARAWDTAQGPYAAPGWKSGDQASWEAQIRSRTQGQNEYSRIAAQPQ